VAESTAAEDCLGTDVMEQTMVAGEKKSWNFTGLLSLDYDYFQHKKDMRDYSDKKKKSLNYVNNSKCVS